MAKEIWNEGRVVGYSAYEMYVKAALAKGITPATEQQWLASSLAMGSSLLLKVDMSTPNVHEFDVALPTGSKLRAANTIVASLFYGEAVFENDSPWATKVSRYFQGPDNGQYDHPSGEVTEYVVFDEWLPGDESWKQTAKAYCNIIDGCVYQPGTWSSADSPPPYADMQPNLAGLPHVRIVYRVPVTDVQPIILLTGFTDSGVIGGCVDTRGSVNTDNPQDGDFLGPAVFPWAAKITFTTPTSTVPYLLDEMEYCKTKIEPTIEEDMYHDSYSSWHIGVLYPDLVALSSTDPSDITQACFICGAGNPRLAVDICGQSSEEYGRYRTLVDRDTLVELSMRGFTSAECGHQIARYIEGGSATYAAREFAYPRPDAIPLVDVVIDTSHSGDEPYITYDSKRMLGKVNTVIYHHDTTVPAELGISSGDLREGDTIISNVPYPIPCAQTALLITDDDRQSASTFASFEATAPGQIIRVDNVGTYIKSPAVLGYGVSTALNIDSPDIWKDISYIGESTTQIRNGYADTPTIDGEPVTPNHCDIVKYNDKTFVWDDYNSVWHSTYGWQQYKGSSQADGPCTYIDEYFIWHSGHWESAMLWSGIGPTSFYLRGKLQHRLITIPGSEYNFEIRTIGDVTEAPEWDAPVVINGQSIPFNQIRVGDVVRYNSVCYVKTSTEWEVYECPKLIIMVWGEYGCTEIPYKWRLRWEIPTDKGVN